MLKNLPKVTQMGLADGARGNYQTVEVMREIAHKMKGHPLVREMALFILRNAKIKSQNFVDEARAIGQFVQKNVRYVRDTAGIEQLHSPVLMIEQIRKGIAQGDCDDMSLLIATLLLSVGATPYFRIVRYKGSSGPFNHIYVVVEDKNFRGTKERLSIDAIIKDRAIGYEVPHKSGEEIRA